MRQELLGESAFRTEKETQQGIPELQKTQRERTSQLMAIKNEAAAIPLQLEKEAAGRGITTTMLGWQVTARLRDNAIQALSVSSLLEAVNGNLALAGDLAERAVAAKYDPIKEEIAVLTANLQLIKDDPTTTLAEKNRIQTQQDLQKKKDIYIDLIKENAQEIYKTAIAAAANGANFIPTPEYPTLTQALTAISKSRTKEESLMTATKSGLIVKGKKTAETAEEIKKENYATANKLIEIGKGVNATYEQHKNAILQNTNLTSTEVDVYLADQNITKSVKPEKYFSPENIKDIAQALVNAYGKDGAIESITTTGKIEITDDKGKKKTYTLSNKQTEDITAKIKETEPKKPWWKFW